MVVVTIGYILVSAALTLMIPYPFINPESALADAFGYHGVGWAKVVISVGALAGMTTTLMGALFALPRLVYAMAQDGLLFKCFARVNQRTQVHHFPLPIPIINGRFYVCWSLCGVG